MKRKRAPAKRDPRKALDLLTAEILELKSRTARNLYHIGARLSRIRDEELWRHGRHTNFDAYLVEAVGFSRTTAYDLIRIAYHFNAEIAARYGPDKLRAVMAYLSATPKEELPGDVFAAQIRLHGGQGRFVTKSLHEATTAEIREATELVRQSKAGQARIPRTLKARIVDLEDALPAPPRGTQSGRRVRLRRGRDGKLAISFQAIPVDDLDEFVAVVKKWLR